VSLKVYNDMTTTLLAPRSNLVSDYLASLNRDFGDFVEELCEGRSSRELGRFTGVNHTTISDMRSGTVPGYRLLERFADGMKLSQAHRYQLFKKARYVMDGTPQERLIDWRMDFEKRHGPLTLHFAGGAASLTHEQVDALIQFYEAEAAEESSGQTERSVTNDAHPKVSEEPPP
jgi:hypothetical protein